MCPVRKQILNATAGFLTTLLTVAGPVLASDVGIAGHSPRGSAGGVAVGEGAGGVTDRAYVTAPPNYLYVVETERGSFLDCGAGQDTRATDEDGRDMATLRCGVTLTETIVIPAAAASARIIVHY
jgi:hypothetical protein